MVPTTADVPSGVVVAINEAFEFRMHVAEANTAWGVGDGLNTIEPPKLGEEADSRQLARFHSCIRQLLTQSDENWVLVREELLQHRCLEEREFKLVARSHR